MSAEVPTGVRRRDFLKVLGASGAATTLVGCSSGDVEKLIPYVVHPDQTVPGVSTYYASTCRECSAACGIIVETRDGRAIKIEGNPAHPVNHGALCARGQSALQGLYNPDRYRGPMIRRDGKLTAASWDDGLTLLSQKLGEVRSRGAAANAVFINQHETGSFPAFLDEWLSAFGMPGHYSYDGEIDHAVAAANRESYGVAWPQLNFVEARLIVSFGADFLDGWGASVPQQLSFADARAKLQDAPRFVYIGARRSLTGLNADEWLPARPGTELAIVNALRGSGSLPSAAEASGVPLAALERLARDIAAATPSLLVSGGSNANAMDVALAVNAFNASLGNVGKTIVPANALRGFENAATPADLRGVAERMNAGNVPLLMVRGANPAYSLPKSVGFTDGMAKVGFKVSFSPYPDETSQLCDLVLPDHHSLEQWGDAEPVRGTLGLQQPTMDPVFTTRATADVLIALAQKDPSAAARYPSRDYRSWLIARFPGGADGLTAALPQGFGGGAPLPYRPAPHQRSTAPAAPAETGDFHFLVYPSPTLGDGRGANKPWLQELPDPVSKRCWQSWVEIHPETARRLGIENGDVVQVETGAGSVSGPAYAYLGIRPDTVAMPLGLGHTAYGRYADGCGANALDAVGGLIDQGSGAMALSGHRARVTKTGTHDRVVTTEGSARQHGRGIAQAMLASELTEHGNAHAAGGGHHAFMGDASHEFLPGLRSPVANDAQGDLGNPKSKDKGMYDPGHWSGMANRRWAMAIDLARCTGCSACVTACYAENNIPTVGAPWQVMSVMPDRTGFGANLLRGREMSWLRLERYFEGAEHDDGRFDANFEARFLPMLCQHCGNAPCEPVCPVFATYHAPDGLNVQVYNRCVGTRYCSNNCPYKVRYMNWFGYGEADRAQYAFPEPLNWQLNPDVTVRGKGVMEKCSFCVQRIREAESRATLEARPIEADEFTSACAQACPSRAITFGDAADENWSVAALAHDRRAYHVFAELNTYTAVVYLKKVNHPGSGQQAAVPVSGTEH